jgi:tetratricopeptide (TPR) repeat protein
MSNRLYRPLLLVAAVLAALWFGYELLQHFTARGPGDNAYFSGNSLFKDGYYERARAAYEEAIAVNPEHLPAIRGLANSLIQLDRLDEALTAVEYALLLDPAFAGHHATKGIVLDRMGRYEAAMQSYQQALAIDPELADGMHWLDRLLYNVQETPPTIADRLRYLKQQMALPPGQRVLRVPEIDARQRPYEQ